MTRPIYVLAILAALMGLVPGTAAAQDQWEQQVRAMLRESAKQFEDEGYELTHRIYTGSLNDDEGENVTLELEIGTEYYIVGACDTDCSDLDLTLYDAGGNQVDIDTLMDDFPIVEVTPSRSGTYNVRVYMASCSVEPCRYGLGSFGR